MCVYFLAFPILANSFDVALIDVRYLRLVERQMSHVVTQFS